MRTQFFATNGHHRNDVTADILVSDPDSKCTMNSNLLENDVVNTLKPALIKSTKTT